MPSGCPFARSAAVSGPASSCPLCPRGAASCHSLMSRKIARIAPLMRTRRHPLTVTALGTRHPSCHTWRRASPSWRRIVTELARTRTVGRPCHRTCHIGRVTVWDSLSLLFTGAGIAKAVWAGDLADLFMAVVGLVAGIGGLAVPRRERLAPAARTVLARIGVKAFVSRSLTRSKVYTAQAGAKPSYSAVLTRADGTTLVRGDS